MRDAVANNSDWLKIRQLSFVTSKLSIVTSNGGNLRFQLLPARSFSLYFSAMASRRLAFSLNQALRSKQALRSIQPLKRNFATPIEPARTECTTLSNGLTVDVDHLTKPQVPKLT